MIIKIIVLALFAIFFWSIFSPDDDDSWYDHDDDDAIYDECD